MAETFLPSSLPGGRCYIAATLGACPHPSLYRRLRFTVGDRRGQPSMSLILARS
jgi:hypothetical protein